MELNNNEVKEVMKREHDLDLKPGQLALAKLAMEVDGKVDAELMVFDASGDKAHVFEDDGGLHVVRGGLRVCFWIGQELNKREFNKEARFIMNALKVPKNQQKNGLV